MAYYSDLTPCSYFGRWEKILIAVGWHEPGHSFATGPVSMNFFAKLVRMLSNTWEPIVVAGHQKCPFCRFTGGPNELRFDDNTVTLGSSNLFVPCNEGVYVTPSLIAHYIDSHEYCPPASFQEAVVKCPEMKSISYFTEIKSKGLSITPLRS
jgi:hypothetical protein